MAPNKHIVFPLEHVDDVAQLVAIPYGDVVLAFQDHPEARFFIRLIVAQLADMVDMFDIAEYGPERHGLIDYEDDGRYEEMYGVPPRPRPAVPQRVGMEVA